MTDLYAVIGNPIQHSKSPLIHQAFARATGQDLRYERILGQDFRRDVEAFFAAGGRGMNVTVPFKGEAWALADLRGAEADRAAAVNTLTHLSDGRLRGDNTDGVGLVRDLKVNHGFNLRGARLLLLGAGGAARGVMPALLAEQPQILVIANRTAARALDLAAAFGDPVRGCALEALGGEGFDLILNATSAGIQGEVPPLPNDCLTPQGWVYDLFYSQEPTAFVRWGQARGAGRALDGMGMLVEQAAEAFALWRGVRPETAPVIQALRSGSLS